MMSTTTTPALDGIDLAAIDLFDPRWNALLAGRGRLVAGGRSVEETCGF